MNPKIERYRNTITRSVYLYLWIIMLYQWYSLALPYQLRQQPVLSSEMEISPWLFRLSGLYDLLFCHRVIAAIFSVILLLGPLVPVFKPRLNGFSIIYSIAYLCYMYGLYGQLTHFEHILLGAFWIQTAFYFKKNVNFNIIWNCVRYYACWTFGSAAVWKIVNGAAFQADFGTAAFKNNYAWYLYQNPGTLRTRFYSILLHHSYLLHYGTRLIFVLEAGLLAGFFTKKLDGWLCGIWWFITACLFLFADVNFAPLGILSLTFLPVSFWKKLYR